MDFLKKLESVFVNGHCIDLYVPDKKAVKEAWQRGEIGFPYWSQVWPAAKALAHFLLNNPACTDKKKVAELGAGLGLPSFVAARNASSVHCSDYIPEAVALLQQSIIHNGLKNLTADVIDWNNLPAGFEPDVVLLSDITYEPIAFTTLQNVINHFLQKGTTVLLSTPQRLMAKNFVNPLLPDCIQTETVSVLHNGEEVLANVMVLRKGSGK